jgi:hypothetical protein
METLYFEIKNSYKYTIKMNVLFKLLPIYLLILISAVFLKDCNITSIPIRSLK